MEYLLLSWFGRYMCEFDTSGAIGRRYRRADESGGLRLCQPPADCVLIYLFFSRPNVCVNIVKVLCNA